MDIGTIVSWIQLVLWLFFIVKFVKQRGKEGFMSLPLKGIYFALLFGLAISATSLYFNYRPRTVRVERIVEKPVDRIVEKTVQTDCPKLDCRKIVKATNQGTKIKSPVSTPVPPSQGCAPGANCAQSVGQQGGITAGEVNFGPPPIKIRFSAESVTSTNPEFPYQTNVTIFTSAEYTPVSLAIVCDVELAPIVNIDFGPHGWLGLGEMFGLAEGNNKIAIVKFGGTAISEDNPLTVHLLSKKPTHVLNVVQAKVRH